MKLAAARRQLGTATQMFLDDLDPISVHCLACGGAEVCEGLAEQRGLPAALALLAHYGQADIRDLRKGRNEYWNAFKHALARNGQARQDDLLLRGFSDERNGLPLFLGWIDYGSLTGGLPIEAQVLEIWYDAIAPGNRMEHQFFPDMSAMAWGEQKAELRSAINRARNIPEVIDAANTERQPLVLRWP